MDEDLKPILYKQKITELNYESLVELVQAQVKEIKELKQYIKSLERVIKNSLNDPDDP